MNKVLCDELLDYVSNFENVSVDQIMRHFYFSEKQFTSVKFFIKKYRPNEFHRFLDKIDGDELQKANEPMHIYIPKIAIAENLNTEQIYKRFNITKKQFDTIKANLCRNNKELYYEFKEHMFKFKYYMVIGDKILNSKCDNIDDLLTELNLNKREQICNILQTLKTKDQKYYNSVNDKVNSLKTPLIDNIYNYLIKHNCGYYQLTHALNITDSEINVTLCINKNKEKDKVKKIKEILKNNKKEDRMLYENCSKLFANKGVLYDLYNCILVKNMTYKEISYHFGIKYTVLEQFINVILKEEEPYMYNKIKNHYKNNKKIA